MLRHRHVVTTAQPVTAFERAIACVAVVGDQGATSGPAADRRRPRRRQHLARGHDVDDGTRIVIDAFSFAGTTAENLAELDAIARTIRIGPV